MSFFLLLKRPPGSSFAFHELLRRASVASFTTFTPFWLVWFNYIAFPIGAKCQQLPVY